MASSAASVQGILNQIVELGFVSFHEGQLKHSIRPIFDTNEMKHVFYSDRWNTTIRYLEDYGVYHPGFQGDFFISLYDGWREMISPSDSVEDRLYIPWDSFTKEEKSEYFVGKGTLDEPRFVSSLPSHIYATLPLPVITFNRHINDRNALLIPDYEFLEAEFHEHSHEVGSSDVDWMDKLQQIMWRGSYHVNDGYSYVMDGYKNKIVGVQGQPLTKIHPRNLIGTIAPNGIATFGADGTVVLNASFQKTMIKDMLKYKYLLDLDGKVSAWSGFYWKLYSNSVPLKPYSHWEQWYYRDLVPYLHYIPMENLSPAAFTKAYHWCEFINPEQCKRIASSGAQFARLLTYEYAVKEYIIH